MVQALIDPGRVRGEYEELRNPEAVGGMVQALQAGRELPPIQVKEHGRGLNDYILVDGHHRLEAYRYVGKPVLAEVLNR